MKTSSASACPAPRCGGFTMVELLVAMTIGLLLTVVIAQLFLGSRHSYQATDDMSRMQENIRYAQQLLGRAIHMAGFKSSPNTITTAVFSGANSILDGVDGGGAVADSLTVRYQGSGGPLLTSPADKSVVDCLGNPIGPGVISSNRFEIRTSTVTNRPALFCSIDNGTTWTEIVADVRNMQILYGEDTNNDFVADRYVARGSVTNMNSVVTVRIALLLESANFVKVATESTKTYPLNGTDVGPFNDLRIRRVVTTTLNLRNRVP